MSPARGGAAAADPLAALGLPPELPEEGREERFVDMLPPEEWPPPTEMAAKAILGLAATLTEVS